MAGGNAITGQFDPLVFQTPWPNRLVIPFEFAYMQQNKVAKIGVISDSGAFGKDGASTIASEAPKFGITVASSQTFNAGDADMTAQLTVIKKSGAQALLIWSSGKEAATVVKNARQLGLTMPIYGGHGNARQEFITGTGAAGEGVRIAAGHILLPSTYGTDTPQYKTATEFVTNFQTAYQQPPSTFAGHAYDALYLVVDAAKTIPGEVTPTAIRDAIEKTSGFAGIGGTFTFSPTDHNGMTAKDLSMYEIKGGAWTVAP